MEKPGLHILSLTGIWKTLPVIMLSALMSIHQAYAGDFGKSPAWLAAYYTKGITLMSFSGRAKLVHLKGAPSPEVVSVDTTAPSGSIVANLSKNKSLTTDDFSSVAEVVKAWKEKRIAGEQAERFAYNLSTTISEAKIYLQFFDEDSVIHYDSLRHQKVQEFVNKSQLIKWGLMLMLALFALAIIAYIFVKNKKGEPHNKVPSVIYVHDPIDEENLKKKREELEHEKEKLIKAAAKIAEIQNSQKQREEELKVEAKKMDEIKGLDGELNQIVYSRDFDKALEFRKGLTTSISEENGFLRSEKLEFRKKVDRLIERLIDELKTVPKVHEIEKILNKYPNEYFSANLALWYKDHDIREVVYYAGLPHPDGYFSKAELSSNSAPDTLFKIVMKGKKAITAELEIVNDHKDIIELIKKENSLLGRVCIFDNESLDGKNNVRTKTPGTLEKEGNRWKIIDSSHRVFVEFY